MICINLNTLYHCIFKIFLSLHFFTAMHCLAYHNHFILFQFSYQNFSWLFSLFHKFIDQTIYSDSESTEGPKIWGAGSNAHSAHLSCTPLSICYPAQQARQEYCNYILNKKIVSRARIREVQRSICQFSSCFLVPRLTLDGDSCNKATQVHYIPNYIITLTEKNMYKIHSMIKWLFTLM